MWCQGDLWSSGMCVLMLEAAVSFMLQCGLSLEARWNSKRGQAFEGRPAAMQKETLKITCKHGRRLNCKTKVTAPDSQGKGVAPGSGVIVKQEADDAAQHLQERNPAEMEAMWLQVKQEIKEEMDAEAWSSSAAVFSDVCVKKEAASEVKVKQEPVDGAMSKRRRRTRDNMKACGGLLDPVAVKKEALDQTEVKQEADDRAIECKQELTPEEMEALWLEIKQEIKEEMEAEASAAGQAQDVSGGLVKREVAGEVKVKRELLEEGNQDGSFHDSQCKQPADPATPKRRRLTRRDLETPAKQAAEVAPGKQDALSQVKVKQEVKTERASHTPSRMESNWLEVKQEVNTEMGTDCSLSSMPAGIKREVNCLVAQSSTVAGITVKKELVEDEMPTQAKGVPRLSAVKEEDRVVFLFCLKLRIKGHGFNVKSVSTFK